METRTKIEHFPKSDWTSDEVDAVRTGHLAHGAVTCVKTEDDANYTLTTQWPVIP